MKAISMLVALMVGIGSVSAFAASEMTAQGTAPTKVTAHKKLMHKLVKHHIAKRTVKQKVT